MRLSLFYTTLLPSLFLLISPLLAVDITLRFSDNHPFPAMVQMQAQVCRDIPPGRCCQSRPMPPQGPMAAPYPFQNYRVAEFSHLQPMDIASTWIPQGDVGGCSGVPIATRPGPGYWKFPDNGNSPNIITGGSYLRLPTRLPQGPGQSAMLEAEGILGTLTGGGRWISNSATRNILQEAANAALGLKPGSKKRHWIQEHMLVAGVGVMRRSNWVEKRGIIKGEKGYLWAQPPGKGAQVLPDLITFNGTNYTVETPGGEVYKSEDGKVFDFSKPNGGL